MNKSDFAVNRRLSPLRVRYAYRRRVSEHAGVALILTLAVLVLLSALVLAFISASILHREISFSSSGQNRAEMLAKTAMDTTVGDLISEIQAGSTTYTTNTATGYYATNNISTNSVNIYIPLNYSTNAATMEPFSTVLPALTNLLKVSQGGTNFWSSSAYNPTMGPARASNDTHYLVSAPSVNGRYLGTNTWLKPYLIDASVASQFPSPSWILITRQGPASSGASLPTIAKMANSSSTNTSYVIGRYSYAIYDVGGLIDANVGGNALTSTQNAQRGRLQQAALSQLPLADSTPGDAANTTAAANLISWRSPVGQTDTNWLFNATNNFTTVDPASTTNTAPDQAFVSRQDLIQATNNGLSPGALEYLTVFSRELNQPSHTPYPLTTVTFPATPPAGTRPVLQAATLGGYGLGNASVGTGNDNKFNPSLVNMRDPSGTANPIFKQRFPLSRLAWITANGPSADVYANNSSDPTIQQLLADGVSLQTIQNGTDQNILTYFGLVWDTTTSNHQWLYTSPEGSLTNPVVAYSINYLSSIPTTRKTGPDFFETLMASISVGSLGRDSGPERSSRGASSGMINNVYLEDQNVYRHVLQIGANIIDNARPDDFPAAYRIGVNNTVNPPTTTVVYGNKNLPYITRLNIMTVNDYPNQVSDAFIGPEVWNPNQQLNTPPANARPTYIRIRPCVDPDNPTTVGPCLVEVICPGSHDQTSTVDLATPAQSIQFSLANVLASTPTLLTYNNSTKGCSFAGVTPANTYASPAPVYASIFDWLPAHHVSNSPPMAEYLYGFYCGGASTKTTGGLSQDPNYSTQDYSFNPTFQAVTTHSFVMEYSTDGSTWHPYAAIRNIGEYWDTYSGSYGSDIASTADDFNGRTGSDIHIDPRTDRLGMVGRWSNSGYYGGLEYDTFTSQTLWHTYQLPPPAIAGPDWREVGEMNWPLSVANDGAGGTTDTVGGGAFHLQATVTIMTAAISNATGKYLETITDNIGPNGVAVKKVGQYSANYYYDPDGTVRPAAGGYSFLTGTADGRPMAMLPFNPGSTTPPTTAVTTPYTMNTSSVSGLSSQPIVLDRPYRSVGELGYVFRDVPWKDIDFFTTASGDAALLDAFSVDDTLPVNPTGTVTPLGAYPVVAGKINLNTRNAVALQAALMGAIRDESSTGTGNQITQADATALANLLITRTTSVANGKGPLVSKADLVLKFVGDLSSTSSATVVSSNSPDWLIKARREAAIRALADIGNVRTWNLMIDIVVQAGKYPPTAQTGDQFVVEGEKHYWLHIALDRFTGQVVDELLEPVYD